MCCFAQHLAHRRYVDVRASFCRTLCMTAIIEAHTGFTAQSFLGITTEKYISLIRDSCMRKTYSGTISKANRNARSVCVLITVPHLPRQHRCDASCISTRSSPKTLLHLHLIDAMLPDSAARRVAALAGHISRPREQGQAQPTCLTQQVRMHGARSASISMHLMSLHSINQGVQDCAAKHTLQYARACSPSDLKFARPAAPQVRY